MSPYKTRAVRRLCEIVIRRLRSLAARCRALTPVYMFNGSAGQSDPFLNIFFRQPIPGTGFLPCHIDAVVDVRNLLAQGYVPLLGQDGRTVYLVQSARSVRGGVAFTF